MNVRSPFVDYYKTEAFVVFRFPIGISELFILTGKGFFSRKAKVKRCTDLLSFIFNTVMFVIIINLRTYNDKLS